MRDGGEEQGVRGPRIGHMVMCEHMPRGGKAVDGAGEEVRARGVERLMDQSLVVEEARRRMLSMHAVNDRDVPKKS